MDVTDKIRELAEASLKDEGHFIVDVLYFSKHRPAKLMVIVDGDKGVNIDACADISRELSKKMDELNLLENAYLLEVTTPGVDHPLKLKRQYVKNVGRQFKVHRTDKSIVQGKLERADEQGVVLEETVGKKEKKLTEIPFEQIEKAFVMVSFK